MQKIPAMPESYGGSLFKASRKSADTSRMRCIRSFSCRKSSGLIPRKVCFAILSIWSRISRSSSSRSSSTLGPSIIHTGLEGAQFACRLIPIVHRSGREVCLSTFLSTRFFSTRAKLTQTVILDTRSGTRNEEAAKKWIVRVRSYTHQPTTTLDDQMRSLNASYLDLQLESIQRNPYSPICTSCHYNG
jgi:hypothetical protein